MYNLRIKPISSILRNLLIVFGQNNAKVTFFHKLQGYGLRSSDFITKEDCSRRVFSHWKRHLLERKYIRIPKHRRRFIDERKFPRGGHYAISPLGICYFSSINNQITKTESDYIIKFLEFHSEYKTNVDWKKTCKILGDNEACRILKQVCDSIEIKEETDLIRIICRYRSKESVSYEQGEYKIKDHKILLQIPEGRFSEELGKKGIPKTEIVMDDDSFFSDLAEFILKTLCYSIIENYHWRILYTTRLKKWAKTTKEQEEEFRNTIQDCQNKLEKIPYAIHSEANNFVLENVFGSLKQEQRLAGLISDHYYQTVSPKNGVSIKNGKKPFSVFSPDHLKP